MTSSATQLQELESAIAGCIGRPDTLGGLLLDLLKGELLPRVLNSILFTGLDSNFLPFGDVGSESIILLKNPGFVLHLKLVHEQKGLLHTVSSNSVTAFQTNAPLKIDRYRITGEPDLSVFQPNVPLTLLDSRMYEGGVIHEERLAPIVYDYSSSQPFVIARISLRPASDQIWFFDRATLRSTFPSLGYTELSGYILLCRMIASLKETRALHLLLELVDHPSHFVRWAAIQALGKLDGGLAYEHLQKASADKHPHISAAASKMLAKLTS